jgi:hypothetical protein
MDSTPDKLRRLSGLRTEGNKMRLLEIKEAWEIEKHDGWGTEYNTRFANLVVPYEGNEFMHQMAKVFHAGFTQGQRFIEEERKKDELEDEIEDEFPSIYIPK